MIIQGILYIIAGTIVGCIVVFFIIRIFNKLRAFLVRKHSSKLIKEAKNDLKERFYNQFGFYYEDSIKYAPELDAFLARQVPHQIRDSVDIKMFKLERIYDVIRTVEQIDIIKFKRAIENIKNQKSLENID